MLPNRAVSRVVLGDHDPVVAFALDHDVLGRRCLDALDVEALFQLAAHGRAVISVSSPRLESAVCSSALATLNWFM